MAPMKKFYVTTPIYYVNSKPHIGSAYTTIAADVLARWHKQQGSDVYFLTGTAEHGTKIAESAAKAGQEPQVFVDTTSALFKKAWDALHIQPTDFIRTTEKRHEEAVVKFFEKLKTTDKVYEGEYEGLYCVGHEQFLKPSELTPDGLCPEHKTKPELIKEKNWFFKLSAYGDILKQKITSDEILVAPDFRKNEVLAFIERGLEDISISRRGVHWAIKLPWDSEQTIYVWLDELFNYCSAIGYGVDDEKFHKYWPVDLHLVGKDIIKFHCVIWPALLLAIGEAVPKKIFAHGHFTVDGQKISKSLGNVIDPVELVEQFGADAVRYYVLREVPFGYDGDVSVTRLKERFNAELANGLGNLVSRTLTMIENFYPEYDGSGEVSALVTELLKSVPVHIEELAFDKALQAIWQALTSADELIEQNRPWELMKAGKTAEAQAVLQQLFKTIEAANVYLAPFLPATHQKITSLLEARPIKKPGTGLFPRLV